MEKIKRENAITLVALVITIIILLILAGIAIVQLTGSGLFENARLAQQKSKDAQEKEEGILEGYGNTINGAISSTRNDTDLNSIIARLDALEANNNSIKITESYSSEDKTTGYVVYSNGLIHQWGQATTGDLVPNAGVNVTVNLLKAFTTTQYNVQLSKKSFANWANTQVGVTGVTTSSFAIRTWYLATISSTASYYWSAIGY